MASINLKEKLQRQLRYEINNKIRQLEVRMFTNVQAIPEAVDIFMTSSGYDIYALDKLKFDKSSRQENFDIIYKCNQNIIKLKLIKKLMNSRNVFCIFKVIIDNKYADIQLRELDKLLNPSEQECEARLATSAGQYAMAS